MIGLYLNWHAEPVDPGVVDRFTRSLGAGIDVAVGHHRTDGALFAAHCAKPVLARAWRPAVAPCGSHVLFNGYLDNTDTLRRDLDIATRDAATLYAAGYARWGDAIDLRAVGQFSTILAHPGERRVRLARSPLQAPPLHVWHDRERVIVASTARIVFASGGITPEIDEQKIADSLYLNYIEEERGWYRNVTRLPAGTHATITPGRMVTRRYYDCATLPDIRLKRDADYVEAANALLLDGTRAALHGFARPAISLSGGLDSQAVAAFAMEATGGDRPLLGLTSVPEAGWDGIEPPSVFGDERHHVAALAAMYPALETETLDAAGLSFDHKLSAMFLMAGASPRNAMNLHWIHALRARAKAQGCDVLLLGALGNLSFSFDGKGAFPSWLARGRWLRLARELNAVRGDRSLARTFASQALLPFMPDALYRRWAGRHSAGDGDALDSWCPLDPDYAREMAVQDRAREMGHDVSFRALRSSRAYRIAGFGNSMSEFGDIRQGLDLIHGIPSRDPTAYRPLVELCIGIPDDQYLRGGRNRWLARRMLRGRIPDMVLNETRRGRQAADWSVRIARDRDALIDELAALAKNPAMARRLDLPKLRTALENWTPDSAGNRDSINLIQHALPRAITAARFIRFVEGSNRA
ncbi:asparagine synthase-related protein [Sphingomonas sp. QA11]|uniref:asparagine synthase-related protein n=1 Tax=Sphingomonas sp. QA11 TaxID=2950605 RepID=UPI0023491922|nr:asparagine synthetase B family protein [Sphingomonas sp. QA11]WCM28756.1 asparagine synthase-related protein [Sphingomonas sp. QA11]